jgi:GNAT superfamily N-acetyltransferase
MATENLDDFPRIPVVLRDGSIAELRPISPDDRPLLEEGFRQMSPESRFARFGSGISSLRDAELRYLTEVDQVSHVAWGATIDDQPAGAGRYILGSGPDAEVAIAVVDRFQRRGLGRVLFDALVASARAGGIVGIHFSIEPWNRRVLRMLPGVEIELNETDDMLEGRIDIEEIPPGERDAEFVEMLDLCRLRLSST